jgi:hypothetical protein
MNQPFTVADRFTPGQYFKILDGWNIANQSEEDELPPPTVGGTTEANRTKSTPYDAVKLCYRGLWPSLPKK